MIKRVGLLTALCLLLLVRVVSAQDEATDAFPIEVRCIGAPTLPPDDWTYPGMILMSGYAGIHAMQADWETPHVIAFFSQDEKNYAPLPGGQLSPDAQWYAMPMGETYQEVSHNIYFFIQGLRLYSLAGDNRVLDFDFQDYSDIAQIYGYAAWVYFPVQWRDNQSLIIGGLLLYPFTRDAEENPFELVTLYDRPVFAPDLTRVFRPGTAFDGVLNGLYDPVNPKGLHRIIGGVSAVYWRHDSSGYMVYLNRDSDDWRGLIYFDRDGNLQEHVLNLSHTGISILFPLSGRTDLQWSPNDQYFVFSVFNASVPTNKLYLIDWQNRVVIDTCLSPESVAVWSPDGKMFAYLAKARENLNLVVVDTTTWQAYIVARHNAQPPDLGSFPEMIGWRSTTEPQ